MNAPTPDADVVRLTKAEAKVIDDAVHWWEEFGDPLHDVVAGAVRRIVADRLAQAQAPTDAREAPVPAHKLRATKAVLAERERELLNIKGPCGSCPLHHAHAGPCDPALSPTAPDAGQRDALTEEPTP